MQGSVVSVMQHLQLLQLCQCGIDAPGSLPCGRHCCQHDLHCLPGGLQADVPTIIFERPAQYQQ